MPTPTWSTQEATFADVTLLGAVARYRYAVLVTTVLAAGIGFLGSLLVPPVYTATATIYLSARADATDPGRVVREAARRLDARSVADDAVRRLGGGITARDVVEQTAVELDEGVGTIAVSAESQDPDRAADLANAVTLAYESVSSRAVTARIETADDLVSAQQDVLLERIAQLQQQIGQAPEDAAAQQELDALQGQLRALQNRIGEVVADAALAGSGIAEIEPAVTPDAPSAPRPVRNGVMLGLLGLVVATGAAYWRRRHVARTTVDPAALLGAPLLAQIPLLTHAPSREGEPLFDQRAVEAYQFLLSSFEFAADRAGTRSVLVTSPSEGDGKSLTALHLARALSIQGRETVLVDADIRLRGLTRMLNAEDKAGLVELAEGGSLDDVVRRYRISAGSSLSIVPAGREQKQPTGLLGTARYRDAVSQIADRFELTIVDGAPLLTVADATAVASQVAGVLLVIDARTSEADLRQVQQRLQVLATPVIGLVVNRVGGRVPAPVYGTAAATGDGA